MNSIPREDSYYHKDDLHKRKVVEHNDLITSVAKMDTIPLKMFELAVSCIDTENPTSDNSVRLSKTELFTFFDVSDSNKHSRFKQAVERMQKQAYFHISINEEGKGYKYESIIPIPYVSWNDYSDDVVIKFNVEIMPYLIDLKDNFTQYIISDIMDLSSKYAIILYKWISMNYNQYENYKNSGKRTKQQLEAYKNPRITVEELRKMTDTVDVYPRFDSFDSNVVKASIKAINNSKSTRLKINAKKIKKGRKVHEYVFPTESKVIFPEDYKSDYLENSMSEQERKNQMDMLVGKAIQSQYTEMLRVKGFIEYSDYGNTKLMSGLAKTVYPKYDEIAELRGVNEVERHLSRVAEYKKGVERQKENLSKYLAISVNQYLPQLKTKILKEQQ